MQLELPFELMLISDPEAPRGLVGSIAAALRDPVPPGRVAVQLRAKNLPRSVQLQAGQALRKLTCTRGIPLIVNGDYQLALELDADGVHLPETGVTPEHARRHLGSQRLIGRSCHDSQGLAACGPDVDYATLSPYFEVPQKGTPLGMAQAAQLCAQTSIPILALGGLQPAHVAPALQCGARGIAVIRAVLHAPDPQAALQGFLQALSAAHQR